MKTLTKGTTTWTYTYDADGLRTGHTDGTNTYEYIYAGDKLVRMVKNGEVVDFGYAGGQLATMTYDGVTYYYVLNGQGDVVALVDSTGTMIIGYYYSAYGNVTLLKTEAETYNDLKYLNPFMYRGYVYDIETTLYYLQSRYYDPQIGRFINADAFVSTGQGILGNNMFAYCNNNPSKYSDSAGTLPVPYCVPFEDLETLVVNEQDEKSDIRDVTEEVGAALTAAANDGRVMCSLAQIIDGDGPLAMGMIYLCFYSLVDHKAPWDIKRKEQWELTIGTPYPGFDEYVIFAGYKMTPEQLGNFTYGFLGYAYQIPLDHLVGGSYYAAGFPVSGYELTNEVLDWVFVSIGYECAKEAYGGV